MLSADTEAHLADQDGQSRDVDVDCDWSTELGLILWCQAV